MKSILYKRQYGSAFSPVGWDRLCRKVADMNGQYIFKWAEETGWLLVVAVGVVVLEALARFDPETIGDWRAWIVGLGANCVRVAAAALLNQVRKLAAKGG